MTINANYFNKNFGYDIVPKNCNIFESHIFGKCFVIPFNNVQSLCKVRNVHFKTCCQLSLCGAKNMKMAAGFGQKSYSTNNPPQFGMSDTEFHIFLYKTRK